MKRMTSSLLALLLALSMLIGMVPAALAAEADPTEPNGSTKTVPEPVAHTADGEETSESAYVTVNDGETKYTTLAEAVSAAEPDADGVITYAITGKVEVTVQTTNPWAMVPIVSDAQAASVRKVRFVKANGASEAEICLADAQAIIGKENTRVDAEYVGLTLSRPNGAFSDDGGNTTKYYTTWLRGGGDLTYTNCTFPNGASNNQYGNTTFDNCQFTSTTGWSLWACNEGSVTSVNNCKFTGTRGIKLYAEGGYGKAGEIKLENVSFNLNDATKAAVEIAKPGKVSMENVSVTGTTAGTIKKNLDDNYKTVDGIKAVTVSATGTDISGTFEAQTTNDVAKEEFNITAGTFTSAVPPDYCADGFEVKKSEDDITWGVVESTPTNVAKIGNTGYDTLEKALQNVTASTPLTWVSDSVWPETTPVYYDNGTEMKFYAAHNEGSVTKGALDWAIEAANAVNSDEVAKIYVRPGYNTEKGLVANSHQNIKTSIAVYGNNASLCGIGWEPCIEYPEKEGEQYHQLTKDISVEIYNLHDGAAVWGQRVTNWKLDVTMKNCNNVHEFMINGQYASAAKSVNNYYIESCTFDGRKAAAGCPVTTTSAGKVVVKDCTFDNLDNTYNDTNKKDYVININNKNGGKTEVEVSDCSFTNCGGSGKEVVRLTGEAEGSEISATLSGLTFDEASAANAIIVGNRKLANNKAAVSATISGTSGTMQVFKTGAETADETVLAKETTYNASNTAAPAYVAKIGTTYYTDLQTAINEAAAANSYKEVTLLKDVTINETINFARLETNGVTELNLGGHTLTCDGKRAILIEAGSLYIKNGTVTSTNIKEEDNGTSVIRIGSNNAEYANQKPMLVLSTNAKVVAPGCYGVTIFGSTTVSEVLQVNQSASIEATGPCPAISGQGGANFHKDGQGSKIVILGTVTAAKNYAIFHPDNGELNIQQNAAISGKGGIQMCSGTLNIIDSPTITATGKADFTTQNDGPVYDNTAAITAINRNYPGGAPVVKISGTPTITAEADAEYAIYAFTWAKKSGEAGIPSDWTEAGKNINISGGTYNKEFSTDYLANGYKLGKQDTDGNYTVEKKMVAEIVGGEKYTSLEEAIKAAGDGATVKLLDDCYGNGIAIDPNTFPTKGLTVDFGNHTYYVGGLLVGSTGYKTQAFHLERDNKIKFQNGTIAGVTEGTKPGAGTDWSGAPSMVIQNYCDLHLYNMTITGGDETVYTMSNNCGNVVIEDTKITAGGAKVEGYSPFAFDVCGYAKYPGVSVTVKGKSQINGDIEVSRSSTNENDVKLALEGGTITGELKIDASIKSGDKTTVTKSNNVTLTAPSDYKWVDNEDGTQSLAKKAVVAKIGDKEYETLTEAIDAAESDAMIDIVNDINTPTVSYGITKNLTIKLNGHTITADGYDAVFQISGKNNANVVLEGPGSVVAFENTGSAGGKYAMAVWACGTGCTVTINGEINFSQHIKHTDDPHMDMIYASEGTIIINDGYYNCGTPKWTLNCYDGSYGAGTAKIIVNGGTFVGYDPMNSETELKDQSVSFVSAGVGVNRDENGNFTAVKGMLAQVVDTDGKSLKAYKTLAEAITAATDGQTVKLLGNNDLTGMLTISGKKFTLDLNGYTISHAPTPDTGLPLMLDGNSNVTIQDTSANKTGKVSSGYTGISVAAGSTLTVKSGTIFGDMYAVSNSGTVNIEGTARLERKSSGYSVYCNAGSIVNMSGGTVFDIGEPYKTYDYTVNVSGGVVENYVYASSVTGGKIDQLVLFQSGEISNVELVNWINWTFDGAPTIKNVTFSEKFTVKKTGYRLNTAKDAFEKIPYVATVTLDDTVTSYEDIDEALTAWATNGGTLKLLATCKSTGTSDITIQKTATIDLNGKTLDLGAKRLSVSGSDTTLTINDATEKGVLKGSSYQVIMTYGNTIIMNGGEICNTTKTAISTGGAFTMNGGKLTGADGSSTCGLKVSAKTATINKGEISSMIVGQNVKEVTLGKADGAYTDVKIGALKVEGNDPAVTFNSGIVDTFSTIYAPTLVAGENAYFTNKFTTGLPAGKTLTEATLDGNTYYKLTDLTATDAAAKITSESSPDGALYADIPTAVKALKAGDTLTLLKDYDGDTLRATAKGTVTIDLGKHKVVNGNGPGLYIVIEGADSDTEPYTVTVKNGSLESTDSVALRVSSNNTADVVVESDVTLTVADGNAKIDLQNAVRLVYTSEDTVRAQIGTGYGVKVGEKNYAFGINGGLEKAIALLPDDGGTVKLLGNYEGIVKPWYPNTSKKITLDLNQKTYTYTGSTGTAVLELAWPNMNLTIKNGTIADKSNRDYVVYGVYNSTYPQTSSAQNLKLTLDGVTLKTETGSGLGVNGELKGNVTVVKNSTIEAGDTGIYFPNAGTLTIENSKIKGGKLGVAVKGGTVNISGDATEISAKAAEKEPTAYYGGGAGNITAEGYALYVEGGYSYDITLNISGGKFTSQGDAIKKYVKDDDTKATRTIAVSKGFFSSKVPEDFCAIGYQPKTTQDPETKLYTVEKVSGNAYYLVGSGKPQYGELSSLIYAAETQGKKITLLKDASIEYIVVDKARTIDINGNTLTVNGAIVAVNGSVADSSNGNGLIAGTLRLTPDNGNQIPIYDANKGGYRLFNCTMMDALDPNNTATNVKIWLGPIFTNKDAYKLLMTGNAHNIEITVTLRWTSYRGLPGEQTFTFTQSLIDDVARSEGRKAFWIALTGFDSDRVGSVTNVTAQSGISSGTGASVSGTAYEIYKGN